MLLFLVGAASLYIWANIIDWCSNNARERFFTRAFWVSPQILKSVAIILGAFGAIIEFRMQNASLEDTLNTITGGDSFVYVKPISSPPDRMHVVEFEVQQSGKYAVYDIRLRVYRADEKWNTKTEIGHDIQHSSKFNEPAMSPGSTPIQIIGHLDAYSDREQPPDAARFMATILTRNNSFVQLIRLNIAESKVDSILLERADIEKVRHELGNTESILREAQYWQPEIAKLQPPNSPDPNAATLLRRRRN